MKSETLTVLFVQSLAYWFRGNVKAADTKLSLAMSALRKSHKLHQLDKN